MSVVPTTQYMSELEEKLQFEKDQTIKQLHFLLETTNAEVDLKDRLIKKCWRKVCRLEDRLFNLLWIHKVLDQTEAAELQDRSDAYWMYLTEKSIDLEASLLESLINVQKQLNSTYQDIVDISKLKKDNKGRTGRKGQKKE